MSSFYLRVEAISLSYANRPAVRNLSFGISRGEIYGLLGPNGAGKTTTIGIVATILKPDSGRLMLGALDLSARSTLAQAKIGLVPQSLCFYPSLSGEENLRFVGRLYGRHGHRLRSRLDCLLELVGLTARRHEPVRTYSGGMKRRLNLALGLVHEPELLLLDEPTVGVDPQSREKIFSAIETLAKEGLSVLYTTHYMEEAERLCQRIGIVDEGRLIAEGSLDELSGLVGRGKSLSVRFENPPGPKLGAWLEESGARVESSGTHQLPVESLESLVADLLRAADQEDNPVVHFGLQRPDLGQVFLHLTGNDLRD